MNMKEVIEHLRLNGLHDEAAAVGVVMEQRAELLEALKGVTFALDSMGDKPDRLVSPVVWSQLDYERVLDIAKSAMAQVEDAQ